LKMLATCSCRSVQAGIRSWNVPVWQTWKLFLLNTRRVTRLFHGKTLYHALTPVFLNAVEQPCPTRRPRYTFLAPSVSTLFEPIININSNFKTKKHFWMSEYC
jgi:hypothetical protein